MLIDLNKIKDELWLQAELSNNLADAYILPIKERTIGFDIVEIENIIGTKFNISIDKLISRYTYANGKSISALSLRNGKKILVRQKDTDNYNIYKYIYIPDGNIINDNGIEERISGGIYIILGDSGISKVTPKEFRKIFKVIDNYKDNDIYRKVLNKESKDNLSNKDISNLGIGIDTRKIIDLLNNKQINDTEFNGDKDNVKDDTYETANYVYMDIPTNYNKVSLNKDTDYQLIRTVVIGGKTDKFIIQNNSGTIEVDKKQFISLIKSNKISNVGLRLRDGSYYLYGIGCRIKDIPKEYR